MNEPHSEARDTPQLHRLLGIIEHLRAPDGCPWDREQSEESMAPHLLEEAYEAVDAIQKTDREGACEELGDVLMNVLMIAQISTEAGRFNAEDVAAAISDKLVRRHPHVFGSVEAEDSETVLQNWEAIKKTESDGPPKGALDGVPANLPALLLATRIGEKAHRCGFGWPDAIGPREKLSEEIAELDRALAAEDQDRIQDEFGDVLFSLVNMARHAGIDAEMALRRTAEKFKTRFRHIETTLGDRMPNASLEEMESLWQAAKASEMDTDG